MVYSIIFSSNMIILEWFQAVIFYIVFSSFAFAGFFFSKKVFGNKIVAYATGKLFGLMIVGYGIWMASSFRILDYQNNWMVSGIWITAILLGIFLNRGRFSNHGKPHNLPGTTAETKSPFVWKEFLLLEAITLAAYFAYLIIRNQNGAIAGGENLMDMALLSASGKTSYFPFIDPWYAGKTVNYYYYGFYLVSLLSNLAHVSYSFAYNFAIGLIYSQSFLFSGLISYFLTRSKRLALLAALLVTTFGTLFFAACPFRIATENSNVCNYNAAAQYFNPSNISNEIPSYSFTVANLHPHLISLPFFLNALILLYAASRRPKANAFLAFLLAINLATCALINAWDSITLLSLLSVSLLMFFIKTIKDSNKRKIDFRRIRAWSVFAVITLFLAAILVLPAARSFNAPISGLGLAYSQVKQYNLQDVQWPTPIEAEIGIWGLFLAITLAALFIERARILSNHIFVTAITIVSVAIIIGVEFVFVKDIFSVTNPSWFRYNTVFKFGFHAWVLLSLAFAWGIKTLYSHDFKSKTGLMRRGLEIVIAIAIIGGAFYPYQARFFYSNSSNKGLDGSLWIKERAIGDWNAINYINSNIAGRSVIAEAVGQSYTTYGRISAFTGMIAPMGWKSHEVVWRLKKEDIAGGSQSKPEINGFNEVSKVDDDMKILYETSDIEETKKIIDEYKIQYVFIGSLEREAYKNLNEKKFRAIGTLLFSSSGSDIFKIDAPSR